jgi:hypothetical protein
MGTTQELVMGDLTGLASGDGSCNKAAVEEVVMAAVEAGETTVTATTITNIITPVTIDPVTIDPVTIDPVTTTESITTTTTTYTTTSTISVHIEGENYCTFDKPCLSE